MDGGGHDLKLLGAWASPFVIRAKLALSFKSLSYENIEEEDPYNRKSELLLNSNPVHKKVPVLIHNGKPICESQLIVQYIDEFFSTTCPCLLPTDPYERATSLSWAAYIDDTLFALVLQGGRAKSEEEKAEAVKQTFVAVNTLEEAFREYSKGKPFFGGDNIGYLDIILGGMIPVAHYIEAQYGQKLFDSTRSPLLIAWMEHFSALDAAKSVLPTVESLVEYGKIKRARAAASAKSS